MNDVETFDKMLKSFENELLALKQNYNIAPSVELNVAKYSGGAINNLYIQYEAGDDAIITDVFASSNAIFSKVSGNSQKVMFFSPVSEATFISTRKISAIVL